MREIDDNICLGARCNNDAVFAFCVLQGNPLHNLVLAFQALRHRSFSFQVVQEYERAVIFRLGRLLSGGAKGPGNPLASTCFLQFAISTTNF